MTVSQFDKGFPNTQCPELDRTLQVNLEKSGERFSTTLQSALCFYEIN